MGLLFLTENFFWKPACQEYLFSIGTRVSMVAAVLPARASGVPVRGRLEARPRGSFAARAIAGRGQAQLVALPASRSTISKMRNRPSHLANARKESREC